MLHMKTLAFNVPAFLVTAVASLALAACSGTTDAPTDNEEHLSGGATTITEATSAAFSFPAPNLDEHGIEVHTEGDAAFEAIFVAGGIVNNGLGPIFNNTSCVGCHIQDGRGTPPGPNEQMSSMLLRISVPGGEPNGAPKEVPGFGGQLQPRGLRWVQAEGSVEITYTEEPGRFADNTEYSLRVPRYSITNTYKPLPSDVMISPRVAPIVFGLGLLEAIPDATILGFADESDANKDGISGRPNYANDVIKGGKSLGRFGHKANTPSLLQQAAGAYNQDMGITSYLFPKESSHGQEQWGGTENIEVDSATLFAAAFYTQSLGVPARRDVNDPTVRRGKEVFTAARCAGCHIPEMMTGSHPIAALSNQKIRPYTDMLLHDMGPGLADGRPDFAASGSEWRTAPLWGIGLTSLTSGHTNFLHDGRARNLIEAVMWHGGEAEWSREYVRQLPTADRNALLKFLQSL